MKSNYFKAFLLLFAFVIALGCADDDTNTTTRGPIAFELTPEMMQFTGAGGNTIMNVHLNGDRAWTVSGVPSWVTASAMSGTGNGQVGLAVAANEVEEARTATITVTSNTETKTFTIEQAGMAQTGIVYAIPPDSSNMSSMTSVQLTAEMGTGWNLGNTLEAIGGETAWGNPMVTRAFIDAVKAAGFNTIRIPVSWSQFSNEADFTINATWMSRVQEVVDYALANNMYVIMNEHWDGGWMQPTNDKQAYVNNRLAIMWTQIATHFRNYDYHLIFAGTNEVMVEGDFGTPTSEYYSVQNGFNQTFVNAVRSTGGRNAYRYLTVQGFNTNIDHTVNFAEVPEDVTANRLLMEVHYYDPYNFALNEDSTISQWGSIATNPALTETWANESFVDAQFQKMKTNFVDQGVGVILGEFGAISRTDVAGHETFREYYVNYISNSARAHGLVPVYWDNGANGNHSFSIFNRNTGAVLYPGILDAILP